MIFSLEFISLVQQITNRVSLEIIGIGYNSSEMDRDRYSDNCLFKVEAGNGEEEEEQKMILCVEGVPYTATSMRYLRDDEPPAFPSLACMFGEALKTNEK